MGFNSGFKGLKVTSTSLSLPVPPWGALGELGQRICRGAELRSFPTPANFWFQVVTSLAHCFLQFWISLVVSAMLREFSSFSVSLDLRLQGTRLPTWSQRPGETVGLPNTATSRYNNQRRFGRRHCLQPHGEQVQGPRYHMEQRWQFTNLMEITNKMRPCSRIYYSNVS